VKIRDFLKVFGKWKIVMRSPDNLAKEISMENLYHVFRQEDQIKYIED
jgi:hypothetical protein